MEIKVVHLGILRTNCYLISSDRAAVVIDPGLRDPKITNFLLDAKDKERLILITHAHFDHIAGAPDLREKTGVPIGVGVDDSDALSDPHENLSGRFYPKFPSFKADRTFEDGDIVTVGDLSFQVIKTPGHTVGGVSYLIENALFSGDTLFEGTVGRTDFPGGDIGALKKSVKKLLALDPDTVVYPGHDGFTTIGRERMSNLFAW